MTPFVTGNHTPCFISSADLSRRCSAKKRQDESLVWTTERMSTVFQLIRPQRLARARRWAGCLRTTCWSWPGNATALGWEPYAQLIAKHDLAQRVVVHNEFIDDRDVPVHFAAADNLVLPYVEASQSGVNALALHHKRKVIASDVGDLSNSIVPELTGRPSVPMTFRLCPRPCPSLGWPSPRHRRRLQANQKRLSWSAWAAQLTQQVESDFSAAR